MDHEMTWLVTVFRRESDGSWHQQILDAELVVPNDLLSTTSKPTTNADNADAVPPAPSQKKRKMTSAIIRRRQEKLKKQRVTWLEAAPREGSIVFPQVRQRYSVKDDRDRSTVIRRDNDRILFSSRRRTRAMLLQFQSTDDCLAFSDRFLTLNNTSHQTTSHDDGEITHNTTGKARATSNQDPQELGLHQEHKEEGIAYMVQLMHDETFLRTVSRLERIFCSSDTGRQMLAGAAERDLSSLVS